MLKIFIGYDPREAISYHVLAHSLIRHASRPISITPLILSQLQNAGVYKRERDPLQSTDFTFSRFLTPYLAKGGVSIFMDCDMLCRSDICELEDIAYSSPTSDVFVVKHSPYEPATKTKFLDQKQTSYPCKNWSSLMVFNGHRMPVRDLTPEFVNANSAMNLHQFKWAARVSALPPKWNHLVGEQSPNPDAKIVHYTLGGPWFPEYAHCEFAKEWRDEQALLNRRDCGIIATHQPSP